MICRETYADFLRGWVRHVLSERGIHNEKFVNDFAAVMREPQNENILKFNKIRLFTRLLDDCVDEGLAGPEMMGM